MISILFVLSFHFYGTFLIDLFKEEDLDVMCCLQGIDLAMLLRNRKYLLSVCGFIFFLVSIKLKFVVAVSTWFMYKKPYFDLKKYEKNLMRSIHYAFPIWIRTIQCLLQNNTMVSAIKLSLDYAPSLLMIELELLLDRLESSPESLSSYEGFMGRYQSLEIKKMMKQLYRYSRSGSDDNAESMYRMVDYASSWMAEVRKEKHVGIVSGYSWLGIIPVASVSIFFVLIMFYVMLQMFEGGWIM